MEKGIELEVVDLVAWGARVVLAIHLRKFINCNALRRESYQSHGQDMLLPFPARINTLIAEHVDTCYSFS